MPLHDEYIAEFFVLRTPLLPIEEFLKLSPAPIGTAPNHDPRSHRAVARAHLRQWLARPEIQEALWLASPDLVQSLGPWWDYPESAKGRKLEQTLYRYLARMTARSTPFGAFAGCSTGEIADSTRLELGPISQYRRKTRLDMEYLCPLAGQIAADLRRRGGLRFRLNSTLHLAAGKYHHVRGEWRQVSRIFQLVATDPTPPLDATLLRVTSGATADELASALVESDPDIARKDADEFIGRLIESQLMAPELMPPVTGTEPVIHMIAQLEQSGAADLAAELRAVAGELQALDQRGLGANPHAYNGIVQAVSRLGGEFRPGRLVQLDLIKPAAVATLDQKLVDEVLAAVQMLHSIRDDTSPPVFQQCKDEFQDRYQDREVPLLEALDDEAGIGFENEDNPTAEPLTASIDFRPAVEAQQEQARARQLILERHLEELRARNEIVLELDPALLEELRVPNPLPLPDAFSVMGAFFRGPQNQQSFYAHTVTGPSGANLLARFRHADEKLAANVQAHIRAEEALHRGEGAVFAEIAHLPEGRVGNVVCRPVLRQYEIPLLSTPGVPAERQIALSDLTLSLREGRIVLRSQRLGVEVLPRLTSAHNYGSATSLKLYKFLCLLQQQDTCGDLFWDWGEAGKASFLPRVTMGNIVFSLACWRINKETALDLAHGRLSVVDWRQANLVPRFASIAEYDNQLLIDFDNPLAVETFLEHIRKQTETVMVEMFPAPEALSVHGPEGNFVHEIILPFVRKSAARRKLARHQPAAAKAPAPAANVSLPAANALPEGSEWLFAKLYCSPSHADRLVLEFVEPLVAEITSAGAADRWFFMRYGDPRWHLRLRFHGTPDALRDHVLPAFRRLVKPFERQGIVWRLEFDHYEPEVERYGGPRGIDASENLFQLDSELCLNLLKIISAEGGGADLRWQLACCGVDCLLSALGLGLKEKELLARQMVQAREQEFVVDQDYKQQLAHAFRMHRHTVATALAAAEQAKMSGHAAETAGSTLLPAAALSAFAKYSAGVQAIGRQFAQLQQANELTNTIADLALSFAHMHLNRILRSQHLQQEAVVCDLLSRTYASILARRPLT